MSKVILTEDHRGLGKRGEEYDCPNDEVADKLIRLGYAVVSEADLPVVTSFEDLQANEDEALLASGDDPAFADSASADAEEPKRKKATRKKSEKKA